MLNLIKPDKLRPGDTVATISTSGGRAGDPDMLWRYELGKQRLREVFGLEVVETPNSLRGSEYIYKNPKSRVEDLYWALENPCIKGIICNQGGDDSYRLLPFIDYDIIRQHPKILMGFSDISTLHNIFTKAGVMSYYGPNILTPIAQPGSLDKYTERWIRRVLFSSEVIGEVEAAQSWTNINYTNAVAEDIVWNKGSGYRVINGSGKTTGRLLGGCGGPLQQILGTSFFPAPDLWEGSLIFLEIGTSYDSPITCLHSMRALAATGMFKRAAGLICHDISRSDEAYILKVIREEEGLLNFPILCGVELTHRTPMAVIPIGALAEIDCDRASFSILESGVK